ncbi:conserved hypothetical protein [Cupriavidus necator]|uniref:Uncharacterized protein n=2 Tax=Cupriavidus necator TaxID=106590 RepID=A0A1K0IFM9_CUPNE|nr:conserved hypothetical protein [Cupriavidus necator]
MRAIFARGYTQRPVMVVAREYAVDGIQVEMGDLVIVRVLDQDVTFSIRLSGPGKDANSWQGTIFYIARGEESLTYAEGLEVNDIVEVSRPEMAEIIKHNDHSGSVSAAKAVPGPGGT